MKKLLFLFICTFTLSIVATACSHKSEAPKDVVSASIKAMEEVNSFRSVIEVRQDTIYAETSPSEDTTTIKMDYIKETEALYQTTHISIGDGYQNFKGELYLVEGDVYSTDVLSRWTKGSDAGVHPSLETTRKHLNVLYELKWLQSHSDKIQMEEKDEQYVLTLSGSGDPFKSITEYLLDLTRPALYSSQFVDNLVTNSLTYKVFIDKETLRPANTIITTDLEMSVDEGHNSIETIQTIKQSYSNFNEVESIVLPDEVRENHIDHTSSEG
jgi:hypothetical protein